MVNDDYDNDEHVVNCRITTPDYNNNIGANDDVYYVENRYDDDKNDDDDDNIMLLCHLFVLCMP